MKSKRALVILISLALLTACSGKKDESAHGDHQHDHEKEAGKQTWKEMDDFHMVMAEAFHPYKDSTNLEPAKSNAASLAEAAAKWASSPIPENAEAEEIKGKLEKLKTDAAAFSESVKTGDDKVIGDQLTKLHDLFHEIQEDWYGGHHGHEHH